VPLDPLAAKALYAGQGLHQFLEIYTIDCDPAPRPFLEVADRWQWEKVIDPLVPAMEAVAGFNSKPLRYDSYWYTLPKGSDKTSLQGRIACWLICYARRRLEIYVVARDRFQAKSLRDAMFNERLLNPWLPQSYTINAYDASGPTGTLDILSKDAKSGHGKRPNAIICDEITVWENKDLWDMVCGSAAKKKSCLIVIIGNAGYKNSWQHRLFQEYQNDQKCYIYEPRGIVASWTDREKVERTRRKISPSEGRRLFDNEWVDAADDAVFPENLVNDMFRIDTPTSLPWPTIEQETSD
jgi:hypothetical protein